MNITITVIKLDTADTISGVKYPAEEMAKAVAAYQSAVFAKTALGQFGEPDQSLHQLQIHQVSHVVERLWIEGDEVKAELRLLNTPMGSKVREMVQSKTPLRAVLSGTAQTDGGSVKDYTISHIDIVEEEKA